VFTLMQEVASGNCTVALENEWVITHKYNCKGFRVGDVVS
jgi:hypothetical protein